MIIGSELFFITKGKIQSAKVIDTSNDFIIFSPKLRRKAHNVFGSEHKAGNRLAFVIRTGFKFSIGINNIKELKETIAEIEAHPEWLI
jgi:hypothetical protein